MEPPVPNLPSETLRFADLSSQKPTPFEVVPSAEARGVIAGELGLDAIKKLSFRGTLAPSGTSDWTLTGELGATVVQPCVTTLAPVTTRIDEGVSRTYMAELPIPEGLEVEMPEDDSVEALPATLDLYEVLVEALSLAVPTFPRAEDAEFGSLAVTEPGQRPMTDEEAKPFAGLAALKESLEKKGESGD